MNWFGKNLCQVNTQAQEGMKRNKENPKAHALFPKTNVLAIGFQPRLLLGIYSAEMVSYLKDVVDDSDHLMHAIEVGDKVAKFLSIWTQR